MSKLTPAQHGAHAARVASALPCTAYGLAMIATDNADATPVMLVCLVLLLLIPRAWISTAGILHR